MATLLDQVDALQEEILALQPIQKDRLQKIDKKFRLEFNYNSNNLEGNTLTYGETELLLIFEDTKGNHTLREYEEMRNHDVAFKMVEEWAVDKERPLTEQNIKNLNEIILVRPFWKEAITPDGQPTRRLIEVGDYKKFPNSVRLQNGEIFHYASPSDTPIEMADLMAWYRDEVGNLHPVTLAAMLHYKLVRIHPFDDGNGRVARLLLNYVLLRNGFPPVIIQSEDKVNYLRVLRQADVGDYEPLISYVAEQLIWSLQVVLRGAKGESLDEPGDFDKKLKYLNSRLNTDGNLEVRVTKNKHTIIAAWDTSILPLLLKIQEKLRRFNAMFKTTDNDIHIFPNSIIDGVQPGALASVSGYLEGRTSIVNEIRVDYTFTGLRKSPMFNLALKVYIVFHTNVYDVQCAALSDVISKRYDDTFDERELQYITDSIGTAAIAAIEKHLDDSKS